MSTKNKIRVSDIVINAEYVIDDLNKLVKDSEDINLAIIRCWKNVMADCKGVSIYDLSDANDLKYCIDQGMTADDIFDIVLRSKDRGNSRLFTYFDISNLEGLHLLTISEIKKSIMEYTEDIVYQVLRHPYIPAYGELYQRLITPMIDNQL